MKINASNFTVLIFFSCLACDDVIAAEDILFRTALTPEEAWVGEKVLLRVDVLAKDSWAQLQRIDYIDVDGAYILRLESQGTRLNEVIEGASYSGQRYEFMIFAQRPGKLTVPPTAVDVAVTKWGVGAGTKVHRLSLPMVELSARMPPGTEGSHGLISTTDLIVDQRWNPEADTAKVGDAIARTITFRAVDQSGMAFPPLEFGNVDGVGVYRGEPSVDDNFNRGDLTGTRVETVTYVFESSGDIEIPGITVAWWDVREQLVRRIEMPGLSLQVIANELDDGAAGTGELVPQPSSRQWHRYLLAMAVALIAALYLARLALRRLTAWRRVRSETESAYFAKLMRSARQRDPKAVLRDAMRWLDRIHNESRPAQLDRFLDRYGDSEARIAAVDLMQILDADRDRTTTVLRFSEGLRNARKRWRKAQRVKQQVALALPELN